MYQIDAIRILQRPKNKPRYSLQNSNIFKSNFKFHAFSQDAEEMREQSSFWTYEHKQYGRGAFTGEITVFHTNRLQVSYTLRSTGIFLRGGLPPKTTIVCYHYTDPRKIFYRGNTLLDSQVMVLNHTDELEYHSLYPSTAMTVAIDTELLNERCISIFGYPLSSLSYQERITMQPGYYKRQASALFSLLQSAWNGLSLKTEKDEEMIENEILNIIFTGVQHHEILNNSPDRLNMAKKAEDYIRSNLKTQVMIGELCEAIGTTERTLHLGFKERFGLSPNAYMQAMRLNGAYQDLRTSKSKNKVSEVAIDWGFNHLGRFAKQYKRMFGKLPSETFR
jgi:AraC family ethanolamine operon transcriptional activator